MRLRANDEQAEQTGIRPARRRIRLALGCLLMLTLVGCSSFPRRHEIQRDNWVQVLRSEASQVKVRNAQSRFYDTKDRERMLQSIVATLQDLGFQISVLDEGLGIVSGKKYLAAERPRGGLLPSYLHYDEESLVVMNRVYRSWGPFRARTDLVRLTVTIRDRNEKQLIVRASAQYYLRPVEDPAAYQSFYATLEQALFTERGLGEREGPPGASADPPIGNRPDEDEGQGPDGEAADWATLASGEAPR